MIPFNGYSEAKARANMNGLPRGGYQLEIKGTKEFRFVDHKAIEIISGRPDLFEIYVDVCEGEYTGYFTKDYKAQTSEDKRWRGVLKLYFPKDDGSDLDESTKRTFAKATSAIEESNPGYEWRWMPDTLKGLKVGGVFNMREYIKGDGTTGSALNLSYFCDIKKIVDGTFKIPDDKKVKPSKYAIEGPGVVNSGFISVPDGAGDDGLPFN